MGASVPMGGVAMERRKTGRSRLTIPNDLAYLSAVRAYVREIARMAGFAEEEIGDIELGVDEAVTNVIQHGFEAGEEAAFDILCEQVPTRLEVIIREKGVPFDPSAVPPYPQGPAPEDVPERGLGFHLIHRAMDEFTFRNLGPGGKETRLIKYLSRAVAREVPAPPPAPPVEAIPRSAEPVPFDVRPLDPSEAIEIARCAYSAYGYTYIYEDIYYPERIQAMIASGQLLSAVAASRASPHEILAHCALILPAPGERVAEIGMAFTKQQYRGRGCLERLTDHLVEEGRRRGFTGLYVKAVTCHVYSQKAARKLGIRDCGILLAAGPQTFQFKRLAPEEKQRESYLIAFRYLAVPEGMSIHVPPHHRAMIRAIYGNLAAARGFAEDDAPAAPLAEQSAIDVSTQPSMSLAHIAVRTWGRDAVRAVARYWKSLCLQKVEVIYLHLNLAQPHTASHCSEFEGLGFFFAGILPGGREGDELILQYLNNVALDYGQIHVESPFAGELLAYVRQRDPNQA